MWFVSKDFLGTQRHLLVKKDKFLWVNDFDASILGYSYHELHHLSLVNFLKITQETIPNLLPENIRKSLNLCGIPYDKSRAGFLIRPAELQLRITTFIKDINTLLSPLLAYMPIYMRGMQVLSECQPARYSKKLLAQASAAEKIVLNSCGYAEAPIYNLSHSKTGRMTVVKGPQILRATKDIKKSIVSRFDGGFIVEIDYSALEPRTALAVVGSSFANSADIYANVAQIFSPQLSRDIAKQVTISFLYGAAKNTIRRLIGTSKNIDNELVELKNLFGFEKIVKTAEKEISENGFFRNHAGRPIQVNSAKRGLLFNNFCQSSAVDVALSGFGNLLDMMGDDFKAVPIYFIHDAIIFDVPPEEVDDLKRLSSSLPTYLGVDFPTKMKILNN